MRIWPVVGFLLGVLAVWDMVSTVGASSITLAVLLLACLCMLFGIFVQQRHNHQELMAALSLSGSSEDRGQ